MKALLFVFVMAISSEMIVVGDVHANYESAVEVLKMAKLIENTQNPVWTGGKKTLIQVGDLLDRGTNGINLRCPTIRQVHLKDFLCKQFSLVFFFCIFENVYIFPKIDGFCCTHIDCKGFKVPTFFVFIQDSI